MVRRRGGTSISAVRPVFPGYLLSSFNFVFPGRKSTTSGAASSSAPARSSSSAAHAPPAPLDDDDDDDDNDNEANDKASAAPISRHGVRSKNVPIRRLSRPAPDTMRCRSCSTDLAPAAQIISKGFTGRHGRAFLVAPSLLNVRVGRSEDRQLVTGWHVVADICCATCAWKLGWKYVDAREPAQKYKVGKYILETDRVVTHRSWEDFAVEDLGLLDERARDGDGDGEGAARRISTADSSDEVVFDSDDEEECEDVFAGRWDAATVAKRRSRAVARAISLLG
ncbi:hypothetical protein E4U41_003847 [Claviceps citrina]|nr:hypothetical protein E4U41_003847 [Claviceps citrina]